MIYSSANSSIQIFSQVLDSFQQPIKKLLPQKETQSQQQPQSQLQLTNKILSDTNCDNDFLRNPEPVLKLYGNDSRPESLHVANEAMKENVIRELLETEENYVKLLSSLCFGYVRYTQISVHERKRNSVYILFADF